MQILLVIAAVLSPSLRFIFYYFFKSHVLCFVGRFFKSCSTSFFQRPGKFMSSMLKWISQFGIPTSWELYKFKTHTCLCWLKFPIPCRFLYPTHLRHVPEGGVSAVSFHTRVSPLRLSQKHRTVTMSVLLSPPSPVSELDSSPNFQICLVGKPLWASMASSSSSKSDFVFLPYLWHQGFFFLPILVYI